MAGGLTEAERGMLMSSMSADSCAMMMGRSKGWVNRKRAAMADLPHPSPVQAANAVTATPWRPEADPFAEPAVTAERAEDWRTAFAAAKARVEAPAASQPAAPVAVRTPTPTDGAQTFREAGAAAIAATQHLRSPAPVARPEHRLVDRPARRWQDLPSPAASTGHERPAVITPDPALLSEKHYERQFVMERRAKGVSWFNISMMTGKTVPYLRDLYGGTGL